MARPKKTDIINPRGCGGMSKTELSKKFGINLASLGKIIKNGGYKDTSMAPILRPSPNREAN